MNTIDYLFISIIILLIYSYISSKLKKNRIKDLCPQSQYPHEVAFPFFCVFMIYVSIFLGMGLIYGFILIMGSIILTIAAVIMLPRVLQNYK